MGHHYDKTDRLQQLGEVSPGVDIQVRQEADALQQQSMSLAAGLKELTTTEEYLKALPSTR